MLCSHQLVVVPSLSTVPDITITYEEVSDFNGGNFAKISRISVVLGPKEKTESYYWTYGSTATKNFKGKVPCGTL